MHDDPLKLSRCPTCGYQLAGLPDTGRCPECGFEYDTTMIVLRGFGAGHRASLANVRPSRFPYILLACGAILVVREGAAVTTVQRSALAVIAILAVAFAWSFWRRRRAMADVGLPTQLHLFPSGYTQRDGPGSAPLHPWTTVTDFKMKPSRPGWQHVEIHPSALRSWKLAMPIVECEVQIDINSGYAVRERVWQWISAASRHRP